MHKIVVKKLYSRSEIKFVLDQPIDASHLDAQLVEANGLALSGWVASQDTSKFKVLLDFDGHHSVELPLVPRVDVDKKAESAWPGFNNIAGFKATIAWPAAEALLCAQFSEKRIELCRIKIVGQLEVLRGTDGWLFLNNDANRSVDQYSGKYLLKLPQLWLWRRYLLALKRIGKSIPYSFLIAPSKEMALQARYPIAKGKDSPVEQVVRMAEKLQINTVYPVDALANSEVRSFRKADTHWSHAGSKEAWIQVVESLGLKTDRVVSLFSKDRYSEKLLTGDLGNKTYPVSHSTEQLLNGPTYRSALVYDNSLPNFGRVLVIVNQSAEFDQRLLIFGSSSSYTMLNYVYRTFSQVVFVHSAGNIDVSVIETVEPDFLVLQSNGRFLVRPPSARYSLAADIAKKQKLVTNEQARSGFLDADKKAAATGFDWLVRLHQQTIKAPADV